MPRIRLFSASLLWIVFLSTKAFSEDQETSSLASADTLFVHSYISDDLPTIQLNGVQSLADYDSDGDLDMTIGSLSYGLYLFQNNGTFWSNTKIGNVPYTALGAATLDVNSDGWIDLISAGVWYENHSGTSFSMHGYDSRFKTGDHFHDIVAADINGDGKIDIVAMGDDIGFFWYDLSANPTGQWERTTIDPYYPDPSDHVHGSFSPAGIGDLDGDGDNDVWRANAWFENVNNGAEWIKHPVTFPELFTGALPYGKSTRSVIVDIDEDGDNDIVFTTCDDVDGKVGIIENLHGDGSEWALILFPQTAHGRRGSLHSLQVVDLNMDGKLDVVTADQEDMIQPGMPTPRWYLFTRASGNWEEKVLSDAGFGSHEIFAKDVDQDGDFDLVGKNWYPWSGNALSGASHADLLKNKLVEQPDSGILLSVDVKSDWNQTGGKWEKRGGLIIGGKDPENPGNGGLLMTKEKYGDCEIVCDVWPDYGIDSGFFLRTDNSGSRAFPLTVDYQEGNPMGGVYLSGINDSANWDFTIKSKNEIEGNPQFFNVNAWSHIWKENDWNQFRIRIEGNPVHITTWINGWKVNEFTDTQVRLEDQGYLGLQVHIGDDWEENKVVRFRNLKIYPLDGYVEEPEDTVGKINFSFSGHDELGWVNVTSTTSFPVSLGNGVSVSVGGGFLSVGESGELSTVFPTHVGQTYNWISQTDKTPTEFAITGLDPTKKYRLEIFASRDDESASGDRTTTFSVVGTDKSAHVNPVGNTDVVLPLSDIRPSSRGAVILKMGKLSGQYGYINALVITEDVVTRAEDIRNSCQIGYFPVPIRTELYLVNLPTGTIVFSFNMAGEKVMDLVSQNSSVQPVSMRHLKPGIYVV